MEEEGIKGRKMVSSPLEFVVILTGEEGVPPARFLARTRMLYLTPGWSPDTVIEVAMGLATLAQSL